MTQSDQDAIIGRVVREHSEAEKKLHLLQRDAKDMAFTFHRLYEALSQDSPGKIALHLDNLLVIFKTSEKVDWSRLSEGSLAGLVASLRSAISEMERTTEERRRLKV